MSGRVALTERFARSAEAGGRRSPVFYDDEVIGFGLQVRDNGRKLAGDKDLNPAFSTRLSYRWDAYAHSPPGNKTLLTFLGGEHILGGIAGYDSGETTDEYPERVATLRALVWAYLRSQLSPNDAAWREAVTALEVSGAPMAKVESR